MYTIKDIVKDGKVAEFSRYFDGNLYYRVSIIEDMGTHSQTMVYEFPVPISDIGHATFNHKEKAILLMRYIRKAIEEGVLKNIPA